MTVAEQLRYGKRIFYDARTNANGLYLRPFGLQNRQKRQIRNRNIKFNPAKYQKNVGKFREITARDFINPVLRYNADSFLYIKLLRKLI